MSGTEIQDAILAVLYQHDGRMLTMARATEIYRSMLAIVAPIIADRDEAIELADDMIGYVPEYFREKWHHDVDLAALKAHQ